MKVIITGARGSQQAPVLDAMLAHGHEAIALSRVEQPARTGVRWLQADLGDPKALDAVPGGADALSFHLPVSSPGWRAQPLLDKAAELGVQSVVFNPSAAVPLPSQGPSASRDVVEALNAMSASSTVLQPTLYPKATRAAFRMAPTSAEEWARQVLKPLIETPQ